MDIAQPVEETVSHRKAISFLGSIGHRFEAVDDDIDGRELGDSENNLNRTTVVIGAEKELGYGVSLGAELLLALKMTVTL